MIMKYQPLITQNMFSPPIPYNYKTYTKDIWGSNTIQPLKTKITAPAQCKRSNTPNSYINLFSNEFNEGYYETEIDLRQIDPTIQSIDKFISSYKTIEISNLGNLRVECAPPDIENLIPNRNVNILAGYYTCEYNFGQLSEASLQKECLSQTDDINFDNTITLYTNNIKVNDILTFATAYTNGLSSENYENSYVISWRRWTINSLFQVTKLSNNDDNKIKETYLQAYYTNDMKLKNQIFKGINC